MKTKYVLAKLLFLTLISFNLLGQSSWVKKIDNPSNEVIYNLNVDQEGNFYLIGHFQETLDFDMEANIFDMTSTGDSDVFICKYNKEGQLIWAKQYESAFTFTGYSLAVDQDGNVYTTGYFHTETDFDPSANSFTLSPEVWHDGYVCKLDSDGNFLWAKQFTGTDVTAPYSIQLDAAGNAYISGEFNQITDFDPGPNEYILDAEDSYQNFWVKLDSEGNFQWAKKLKSTTGHTDQKFKVDAAGNSFLIGKFDQPDDFDPGPGEFLLTPSSIFTDIFLLKLDTNGDFVWVKQLGGEEYEGGNAISLDASGNIYLLGEFTETMDADPGTGVMELTAINSTDMFVIKLDSDANFIWAKQFGGNKWESGFDITVDQLENVYVTGRFIGTIDLDPSSEEYLLTEVGNNADGFNLKLDAAGNFVWGHHFSGPFRETPRAITVDPFYNVITIGGFKGAVEFDVNMETISLTAEGEIGIFVHKIDQTISSAAANLTLVDLKAYPNPIKNQLNIEWTEIDDVEVTVRNTLGQILSSKKIEATNSIKLAIPGSDGLYFVDLNFKDNGNTILKVIKAP